MAGHFTACASRLLLLLLLGRLPAAVQAQFEYAIIDGAVIITAYTGPGGEVIVPETIEGLPVTSIGDGAFYGFANLTSITIPNSVTSIPHAAFHDCARLTRVTLPNSITHIEGRMQGIFAVSGAFAGCADLLEV